MASVVYYKLKSAIQQQHVNFDGSVIQIGDVKRLVAQKQGLGVEGATELTLFDPNTGVEYADDSKVIPRNTLVIVKRTPAAKFQPLVAGKLSSTVPSSTVPVAGQTQVPGRAPASPSTEPPSSNDFGAELYSEQPAVVGEDETRALQTLLQGTAASWQREVRQGALRGRGRGRGRGGVASDYRCPRCEAVGAHWLQDCPTQGDPAYDRKRIRPPVGIPMTRLARSDGGGLVLPDGQTGTLVANEDAFAREILGLGIGQQPSPEQPESIIAGPGAGAGQQQQQPFLALDNKPFTTTGTTASGEIAVVSPAVEEKQLIQPPTLAGGMMMGAAPKLAGEDVVPIAAVGGQESMPGASFFELYMRASLLPRGPPQFLERAYGGAEPLSKEEFERTQDEYRRRFNLPYLRRHDHGERERIPVRKSSERERRGGDSRRARSRSRDRDRARHRQRSRSRSRDRDRDRKRRRSRSRSRDRKKRESEKDRDRKSSGEKRKEKERSRDGRDERENGGGKKESKSSSRARSRSRDRLDDSSRKQNEAETTPTVLKVENHKTLASHADEENKRQDEVTDVTKTPGDAKDLDLSMQAVEHEPELDYGSSEPELERKEASKPEPVERVAEDANAVPAERRRKEESSRAKESNAKPRGSERDVNRRRDREERRSRDKEHSRSRDKDLPMKKASSHADKKQDTNEREKATRDERSGKNREKDKEKERRGTKGDKREEDAQKDREKGKRRDKESSRHRDSRTKRERSPEPRLGSKRDGKPTSKHDRK